jgi:hypothetical protein
MIYVNVLVVVALTGLSRQSSLPTAASGGGCDPASAALFTPARPELGRYEVCTTNDPLDGDAEPVDALDAFGMAGSYDRAKLQRLYGGTRVRVTRSWTANATEFVSTTRLSPYPDATLTHLHAGTMEIRFIIRRGL